MVQNIILMNESQEVGGLRNLLAAAGCQTSATKTKHTLSHAISDIIGRNVKNTPVSIASFPK